MRQLLISVCCSVRIGGCRRDSPRTARSLKWRPSLERRLNDVLMTRHVMTWLSGFCTAQTMMELDFCRSCGNNIKYARLLLFSDFTWPTTDIGSQSFPVHYPPNVTTDIFTIWTSTAPLAASPARDYRHRSDRAIFSVAHLWCCDEVKVFSKCARFSSNPLDSDTW